MTASESKPNAVKQWMPVLLAVLGVLTLSFLVMAARDAFSTISDLPEFMAAAKMTAAGSGSQIYVVPELARMEQLFYPSTSRSVVMFFVPPFGLPWLMPLALLPPNMAPVIWKVFLVLSLAISIPVLQKAFSLNRTATCWLIAGLCFSGCTFEALRIDQLSTPMFLAFCCAILALKKERPYLAALALSVLVLKPQELLPFVIFLFGAKQNRTLLALIGIGLALTAVGYLLVGPSGLSNYSALMKSTIEDNRFLVSDISCTLRGQLFRLFPHARALSHYISIGVLGVVSVIVFLIGRRLSTSKKWLDYGLIAVMPVGFVSALYCYYYDLFLLVPTVVLLMTEFEHELPPWSILAGMMLVLAFMMPFSLFIQQDWILKGQMFNPHFAILTLFAIGTLAFFYSNISKKVSAQEIAEVKS
jgi:Glycosyltransferase family 87